MHMVILRGRKATTTSKTQFLTCSFSLRFLCDFWRAQDSCNTCKAAARLLQGKQGVRMTDVIVHHPRKITVRIIARLPQECCETYDYSLKSHNGHTAAVQELNDISLCLATVS